MTQKWQQMDHTTTAIAMVLCLFGLMMMTSAFAVDEHGASLLMRQGMFLLLGFALVYGVCLLSHGILLRGAVAMLALGIVMLVAVLFVGNSINGASRWLPVGKWLPLGSLSVQPVELVKPAFALVSAWLFVRLRERGNSIDFLLPPAILAIIVFLLLGQPDVGQSIVITMMWLGQLFVMGITISMAMALAVILVVAFIAIYAFLPHVVKRVRQFLSESEAGRQQTDIARDAMSGSGWWGEGAGQGVFKHDLPYFYNDFVFATAVEEYGFMAALVMAGGILMMALRQWLAVVNHERLVICLAVWGLMMSLVLSSLFHIATNVQLMPPTGIAFPFVSYGGSALWGALLTIALSLNLSRQKEAL